MSGSNFVKLVLFSLFSTSLLSAPGVQLHSQIQEKLQLLATVDSEEDRQKIQAEILELQQEINRVADERQGLVQGNGQAQSPLSGMNNRFLNRDTYFYRGPVPNPNAFTPFLNQSWQRGYGANNFVMEGAPVPVLNHRNPYINEVPNPFAQPRRNPYTNPWETGFRSAGYQRPGSQYLHPNRFLYPGSQFNQYRPGNGFNPYFGHRYPGHGFHPRMGNYGNGYYRPNQVELNNQSNQIATYDAIQRYRAELNHDPYQVGSNHIRVEVKQKTKLPNGQIQITVTTTGGITGQGRAKDRYYLYSNTGSFLKQLEQPMIGGSDAQQTVIQRFNVSNEQKFKIDRWLAERGFNQYGDPLGTMYAGGNPLHSVTDGGTQEDPAALRFNLILSKHPELVNLFLINAK
tara:strand:- start:10590 stop:11792 length:1203 start_codon:yes stop_codon:yes gene_type:complete